MTAFDDLARQFGLDFGPPKPPASTKPDPALAIYRDALRTIAAFDDPEAPPAARIARRALREAEGARKRP